MFYKKFARNLFQHSTKFLIVLSLASFLGACASSDDDDEKAPAKTPTHNDPMTGETITLKAALEKTASVGTFATNPDMNMLQAVDGAEIIDCPAVNTADSFLLESLNSTDILKKALGKISNGLSQCETFITNAVTNLMEDVSDATVEIGTDYATDNGTFDISYGGMVDSTSKGALNVTDLAADSTASAHWLWQGSSDSTVSLVVYVDSNKNAYAIGKQESAGKGVFKIYCKTNVTGEDIRSYCLQYRYADASGDFDANTKHAGNTADASTHSHYIGNLKVPHAYAFTTGTDSDTDSKLSTGLEDLADADYTDYTYDKFNPMILLLQEMVSADREDRKTALQTTELKETLTAAQGVLNYSAKATDAAKLAKAYEELMAGATGAK